MAAHNILSFGSPSQFSLALASAIVKSKPLHLTIRDYILHLRKHILLGQKLQVPHGGQSNLDSTSFWREAYERSEAEKSQLLNRIYELEQLSEVTLLKNSQGTQFDSTPVNKKRPMRYDSLEPSARSIKRSKTDGTGSKSSMPDMYVNGMLFSGGITTPFMRHIYTLQKLLKKKSEPGTIAINVAAVCISFETILQSSVQKEARTKPTSKRSKTLEPPLEENLRILPWSYGLLLQALDKASRLDDDGTHSGLIVYHITKLFRLTLQQCDIFLQTKAKQVWSQRNQVSTHPKSKRKSQVTKPKDTELMPDSWMKLPGEVETVLSCFINVLAMLIVSLEYTKTRHRNLLEGFLFTILEHIGRILGFFVFKDLALDSKTKTTRRTTELLPACLLQEGGNKAISDQPAFELAARWSSKHLIWLLEKVMVFIDQHKSLSTAENNSDQSFRMDGSARTRLQNTLLKGLFGSDDADIGESLSFPIKINSSQTLPDQLGSISTEGGRLEEWFMQEAMAFSFTVISLALVPLFVFVLWTLSATGSSPMTSSLPTLNNKRICLLIAHPDDEAMFFAPTLLALTKPELGNHVKILCLSSGDADGLGHIRKKELQKSGLRLGLRDESDVFVVDDPSRFPDSMKATWSETSIASLLASAFAPGLTSSSSTSAQTHRRKSSVATKANSRNNSPSNSLNDSNGVTTTHNENFTPPISDPVVFSTSSTVPPNATIDVLLTFDRDGVSNHPNHRSLYHGAREFLQTLMRGKSEFTCPVTLYTLTSTNMFRKYIGVLDAPITIFNSMSEYLLRHFPSTAVNVLNEKEVSRDSKESTAAKTLVFVSGINDWLAAWKAMVYAHKSQMVWFRWGWITVGRYMFVNDLNREQI
ncbi:N-acetylglucosaminyl-phosphatidylinositol de-N-acetylase [Myotisia sp. PD_48]|nr:N-acetylglucosaminyl-phosphatidylinositol de-N-acetylase [Myotisia sp. PD_48]